MKWSITRRPHIRFLQVASRGTGCLVLRQGDPIHGQLRMWTRTFCDVNYFINSHQYLVVRELREAHCTIKHSVTKLVAALSR